MGPALQHEKAAVRRDVVLARATWNEDYLKPERSSMKAFLSLFGMSVGGWIGWALGAQISIFTAFIVSMVGTGAGLFYTRRAVKRFLP